MRCPPNAKELDVSKSKFREWEKFLQYDEVPDRFGRIPGLRPPSETHT